MKADLIKKLVCIECGSSDFLILPMDDEDDDKEKSKGKDDDIRNVVLVCKRCGHVYAITKDNCLITDASDDEDVLFILHRAPIPPELKKILRKKYRFFFRIKSPG